MQKGLKRDKYDVMLMKNNSDKKIAAITYSQDYLDVGNDGIVKRCTSPFKILAVDKNGKLYDVNNHGRKNHLWGSGNNLYDIFLNNTNYLLEVKK